MRPTLRRAVAGVPWLAALVAVLAAAACTPREPARELTLFSWSEYVPRSVIDGFTRETGIRVAQETFASNEEMLAKLVSGATRYDVIQPSEYTVEALIRAGRLQPIDWSKVPNARNIAPEFRNLPFDPEQRFTVPWMGGTVGIVVNSERIAPQGIRGYADVFQEKHRGRIVVVDDPREIVSWALATQGLSPNEVTPEALERARPIVARWLPLVKVFDSDSPKTALLNGDVDLGVVWSGEAALLYREDPKFAYVLPAEGAHRFVDTLAVPADAPDPDAAFAFLNYVLRPDVSRQISAEFPYTNPNQEARRLLTAEELANPASYPPAATRLETFRDIGDAAVRIDRMVTDLKARS